MSGLSPKFQPKIEPEDPSVDAHGHQAKAVARVGREAGGGLEPQADLLTRGLHDISPSDDIADEEVIDVCDNEEVSDNLKKLLLARQVSRGLPKLERCHSFSIDELMRK